MSASTAKRLAVALSVALLIAVAVCWGPGSRPDPAPTATEVAVSAPAAAATPTIASGPTASPAPTAAPSPTAGPAPTSTPVVEAARPTAPVATSTPFTLSDLAATSTPLTALLPPALPTVIVLPTPTATPAPIATPTAAAAASPTTEPTPAAPLLPPTLPSGPTVVVGGTVFSVDVASTPEEKRKGLSGREGLAPMSGMLFLYASGGPHEFWMKDMLFAIDIVWIAPDCTVGDITHELQPPRAGAPDSEVLRARPSVEAAHVLEIVAGASRELGLRPGDPVRFLDISEPAGDSC